MQWSHVLPHCNIDLCGAASYMNIRQGEETVEHLGIAAKRGGPGKHQMEQTMNLNFFRRYFHARSVYWNVVRELSYYTDRELHDLGIDRADIPGIAKTAAAEA